MSKTGYEPSLDKERLGKQLAVVRNFMRIFDDKWLTLGEISQSLKFPEASISARLRDLRRLGYVVDKRRRGEPGRGLWEYKVSKPVLENRDVFEFMTSVTGERA